MNKGNEIPEHVKFRSQMKADATGLSKEMLELQKSNPDAYYARKAFAARIVAEIALGEADRRRWPAGRVKREMDRLSACAKAFLDQIKKVQSSQSLYSGAVASLCNYLLHVRRVRRTFHPSARGLVRHPA